MRVKTLSLCEFRSFPKIGPIDFANVTVFIGPNNSGKSTILKALYLLQTGSGDPFPDIRNGARFSEIAIGLEEVKDISNWENGATIGRATLRIRLQKDSSEEHLFLQNFPAGSVYKVARLPDNEPHHFIVPYLSKRKTNYYQENIKNEYALKITTDMSYLAAKLSRVANPSFPAYESYSKACKEILGFLVTAIPSENGQRPGVYLPNWEAIPITQMGEGVPNIVTLLADLALSKNKLFLIEEPENDLHPQALKALLDLILESSKHNQFVVSTHSNIVMRYLASAPDSKLYSVENEREILPPIAEVREIESTVNARIEVLRELGYSFSDFDLWEGWLILEESSAERIIRDYLIPWFAPKLTRIRTLAAGGVSKVEPTFDDFHRLVLFTHLEEAYRNSTWVRIDGDENGIELTTRLRKKYNTWNEDRFGCFNQGQFERYYPASFQDKVEKVLQINDKNELRTAKKDLLDDVRNWLDFHNDEGKKALEVSAKEVIDFLKLMEKEIFKT